jgi:uncharacterized membrane protein YdbT with pleckstrin-like domain
MFLGMAQGRGYAEGEQPVLVLHPHWKVLVGPVLLTIVVVAALLVGEVLVPSSREAAVIRVAIAAAAVLVIMLWLMVPLLRWRTTVYELTTRRLSMRTGIIARRGRDIPLARITDVSFAKSLLDRMLGCGRLVVESAGMHGEEVLNDIPRVERAQAIRFQLVEEERNRVSSTDERRRLD